MIKMVDEYAFAVYNENIEAVNETFLKIDTSKKYNKVKERLI